MAAAPMSRKDPAVELSLLQRRFPEVRVPDCGKLLKDFFCARQVDTHSHEGRLFLTEKTLFFASTYSDAKDYDAFMSCSDIEKVVAFQRGIIPTVEITLGERKEVFSNFYHLSGVVALLETLLPEDTVTERKHAAFPRRFTRMTSAPHSIRLARSPPPPSPSPSPSPLTAPPEHSSQELPIPVPKADPCPFFAKAGFCPRQPLCKLDHTPLSAAGHKPASLTTTHQSRPSRGNGKIVRYLGSPKRFHRSDSETEGPLPSGLGLNFPRQSNGGGSSVEYNRSVSLPARLLNHGEEISSQEEETLQGKTSHEKKVLSLGVTASQHDTVIKSLSDSHLVEMQEGTQPSKQHTPPSQVEHQATSVQHDSSENGNKPTLEGGDELPRIKLSEVPKSFDFTKLTKRTSDPSLSPAEVDPNSSGSENVFMFRGSNPASPEHVVSKRKNAAVRFCFSPGVKGEGEGEGEGGREGEGEGSEEMAMLAQQLELESDDNDSLHGDLDIESQRRMLAVFGTTPEGGATPFIPGETNKPPSEKEGEEEGGSREASHKRHPCIYFLSGYCRNGPNCPNYHGADYLFNMDSDVDEIDLEAEYGNVTFPSELKVYSAESGGRGDINSGDKIILSPQILIACEQKQISYPMAFKLEHRESGRVVHAGVLEFTSPSEEAAYLPQWMIDHLHTNEGDTVAFEYVELPKGTFVRLQPVSSAWLGIPYDKRMAMMEFQLRNFQTLTEGTKVTLTYELNRYTFKVLECKPAKGISIVDADITTDIVEPADFNRFHSIEEGQAEHIALEEPMKCSVDADTYRHFVLLSLPGYPLPSRLRVEVKKEKGDPDLFLSQTCTAPTQKRYTWCNQDVGDSVFYLSTDDKDYDVNKPLYAGVVCLREETEFTICFHREDTLAAAKARQKSPLAPHMGQTLRTTHSPDQSDSSNAETALPPGHERCSYCGSVMPSLRLIMHERHCALSTFKCPLCKVCLPKAAEKKHHYIAHEPLACECGMEFTQLALHHHQEVECTKRTVKCSFKWCNLSFPMDQLQAHENLCGRKKVPCSVCKEEVAQLELEMHLQVFHSVNTSKIDWSKPLISQVLAPSPKSTEPKFKCPCGTGFGFQDDLQVHQLTECPLRRVAEDTGIQGEIIG